MPEKLLLFSTFISLWKWWLKPNLMWVKPCKTYSLASVKDEFRSKSGIHFPSHFTEAMRTRYTLILNRLFILRLVTIFHLKNAIDRAMNDSIKLHWYVIVMTCVPLQIRPSLWASIRALKYTCLYRRKLHVLCRRELLNLKEQCKTFHVATTYVNRQLTYLNRTRCPTVSPLSPFAPSAINYNNNNNCIFSLCN